MLGFIPDDVLELHDQSLLAELLSLAGSFDLVRNRLSLGAQNLFEHLTIGSGRQNLPLLVKEQEPLGSLVSLVIATNEANRERQRLSVWRARLRRRRR